jgi:hypothetical protein
MDLPNDSSPEASPKWQSTSETLPLAHRGQSGIGSLKQVRIHDTAAQIPRPHTTARRERTASLCMPAPPLRTSSPGLAALVTRFEMLDAVIKEKSNPVRRLSESASFRAPRQRSSATTVDWREASETKTICQQLTVSSSARNGAKHAEVPAAPPAPPPTVSRPRVPETGGTDASDSKGIGEGANSEAGHSWERGGNTED